jgi:hypothetical protein
MDTHQHQLRARSEGRQTEQPPDKEHPLPADSVQVVLRLRTLGSSELNPPQTEVIERLETLTEDEESSVTDLDIDIWGVSMGITQTDDQDPVRIRERVAEFEQWADEQGYTLRPAFEWRPAEAEDTGEGEIVTPLIILAVYEGEHLQAVYPHVDGNDVCTVSDGVKTLA